MDIGRCIQDARLNAGFTQAQLAEELNQYDLRHNMGFRKKFARNDVEQWENNRKEIKQVGIIVAMAEILKTDCHSLLTGADRTDQALAEDLGLEGMTLQRFRNKKEYADLCNFFFNNRILGNSLITILGYLKKYIETPFMQIHVDNEDTTVLLADIRKARLDKEIAEIYRHFQADKRSKSNLKKGGKTNVQTGKRGRNSKEEEK